MITGIQVDISSNCPPGTGTRSGMFERDFRAMSPQVRNRDAPFLPIVLKAFKQYIKL
jgi:hypothetical protein